MHSPFIFIFSFLGRVRELCFCFCFGFLLFYRRVEELYFLSFILITLTAISRNVQLYSVWNKEIKECFDIVTV